MAEQPLTGFVQDWSRLLGQSFATAIGHPLIAGADPAAPDYARRLFDLPQPLVSHGAEADPVFCYANRAALHLWGLEWSAFTQMPSRLSAEPDPDIQHDRSRFLAEAAAKGWVADYSGIRRAADGRRFRISRTVLWMLRDGAGRACGQAALIGQVTPL
jgi:PAS domain-containing protein